MKKDYTHYSILLDRSGSMNKIKADTIGGFNQFLREQQGLPGEATITLAQFDDQYEVVINGQPIRSAQPLTDQTFQPRGWTALDGGIGRLIEETGSFLAAKPESDRPEKVIFVIITDGDENYSQRAEWSRQYTQDKVRAMIEHQTNPYKWQFVYIGANQDAILNAGRRGISASASLQYSANSAGTQSLYASLSNSA